MYRLSASAEKTAECLKVEKKYSNGEDIGYVGEITQVNPTDFI